MLNESALSEAARRRFTAEANVTAGLAHRHIVQVFDANVTADGRPYLVMPYYPQPNLSVRARRAHFSVADVLRIGIQIGSAVETSHRNDVLHRDIKPQNILTDSYGEPALTDFGIATTKGGDGPEGLSVPWSPPEILYGTAPGDQRSDVYSLGATLWHLLVGRSPFEQPGGDNGTFALMGRIKSDPPPRTQRADVPDSLERLLRQAMAKDPAARPQSAMELIRGLQSVEQELRLPLTQPILLAVEPSGDTRGATRSPGREPRRRHRLVRSSGPEPTAQARSRRAAGLRAASPAPTGSQRHGRLDQAHARRPARRGRPTRRAAAGAAQPRLDPWGTAGRAGRRPDPRRGPAGLTPCPAARPPRAGPRFPEPTAWPSATRRRWRRPARSARRDRRRAPPRRSATARAGRRALALAGGGMLLVAAAAAASSRSARATASSPRRQGRAVHRDGQRQNALGPGAPRPATPAVTASQRRRDEVRFSWTYANHAAGDTFRWRRVSGTAGAAGGVHGQAAACSSRVPRGQTSASWSRSAGRRQRRPPDAVAARPAGRRLTIESESACDSIPPGPP